MCFGNYYSTTSQNHIHIDLPITYTTYISLEVQPWTDNSGSYSASQTGISWTLSDFEINYIANRNLTYIGLGY